MADEHSLVDLSLSDARKAVLLAAVRFPNKFDGRPTVCEQGVQDLQPNASEQDKDDLHDLRNLMMDYIRDRNNGTAGSGCIVRDDGSFDDESWAIARVMSLETIEEVRNDRFG